MHFKVDKRAVWGRYNNLSGELRNKLKKKKEKQRQVETKQMTDVGVALEELIRN